MKILYAGSPEPSAKVLEHLLTKTSHSIIGVLTQPDKRRKRGNIKVESAVSKTASKHSLEILKPVQIDDSFKNTILGMEFDVLLVSAYGKILPCWLLNHPKLMAVNIHYSLLPLYRGASPIQSAILNGDKQTGITFIKMSERMDEGDMIEQYKININNEWRKDDLENKLCDLTISKIGKILDSIEKSKYLLVKQNAEEASYCHKIKKEDGVIDFNNTSSNIFNRFKALNEWPGVSFLHNNLVIKIHNMAIQECNADVIPGKIIRFDKDGIAFKTIDSSIVITHLQFPNKNIISSNDAFNAYKDFFKKINF